MYISKSKRPNEKYYITISKGVRDPETKKSMKIMIKSYGTHELSSLKGKKALAKAEADLKEMIQFEEDAKGFKSFKDFVTHQKLSLNNKEVKMDLSTIFSYFFEHRWVILFYTLGNLQK